MRRLWLVALVSLSARAVPAASGQPVVVDSLARLPTFNVPITEDFAPPHASAARAYLYSAVATGGLVAAGLLVEEALGDSPPESDGSLRDGIGPALVIFGVLMGPSVGNLSLGAVEDARRAFVPKAVGLGVGAGLGAAGLTTALVCTLSSFDTGDTGGCGTVVIALFVSGAAAATVGVGIGTVRDLSTIPANAERARRYRQAHPHVTVAPGWRSGGPALSVRVGL